MRRSWSVFLPCVIVATAGDLALGCGQSSGEGEAMFLDACLPTLVVPSGDATDGQRADIAAAIAGWGAAGGPPTSLADRGQPQSLPIGFQAAAPAFFGLYRPDHGDILINRALSGTARAITIAHEIGHAFGLPHVTTGPSLMNPGNLQIPPGDLEVRMIEARRGLCPGRRSELPAEPAAEVPAVQAGVLPRVRVGAVH